MLDYPVKVCYNCIMKNTINFDKKLPNYVFDSCIHCGAFIRTKDKARLTLFMMDHYGKPGIRRCRDKRYGRLFWNILNWKHRNP